MKITGQILKENRERKGVTLNEVSLSTKITIKTLVAIEEGDPINLPPKTFLRGFVRSYAIFLGVDTDEILRTFHEEMGSTLSRPLGNDTMAAEANAVATEAVTASTTGVSTEQPIKEAPPFVERRAHPRTPKKIDAEAALRDEPSLVTKGGIVAGILILIVLIVVLKGKMDSYESERSNPTSTTETVETVAPQTDSVANNEQAANTDSAASDLGEDGTNTVAAIAVVAPTATPVPSATPIATPAATPTPKPSPTPTATPAATPTPKPSPTPTATPAATPTPKPSPTPTATPAATPTPKPSPTPTPIGAAPAGKSHEILIEALDGVDVEVTIDGEAARTIKLRGEQVQSIKVKRKAILKLSDGGAVNLIVNGVDRGVPGDLGKPTRVELP